MKKSFAVVLVPSKTLVIKSFFIYMSSPQTFQILSFCLLKFIRCGVKNCKNEILHSLQAKKIVFYNSTDDEDSRSKTKNS